MIPLNSAYFLNALTILPWSLGLYLEPLEPYSSINLSIKPLDLSKSLEVIPSITKTFLSELV